METRKIVSTLVAAIMAVALIAVAVHHSTFDSESNHAIIVKLDQRSTLLTAAPSTDLIFENGACGSEVQVYNKQSNDALLGLRFGQGYPVSGQFSTKEPAVKFSSIPDSSKSSIIQSCKMTRVATTDMNSVQSALSGSGSASGSGSVPNSPTTDVSGSISGSFNTNTDTSSKKAFWGWEIECSTGMQMASGASLTNGCPRNNGACFISGMKKVSYLFIGAEVAFADGNAQNSASLDFKGSGSDKASGASAEVAAAGSKSISQAGSSNVKNLSYRMYGVALNTNTRSHEIDQKWSTDSYKQIVDKFYADLAPAPYSVRTTLYSDLDPACVDKNAVCETTFNQAVTRITNTLSTVKAGLEKAQSEPSKNKVAVKGYLTGGFMTPWQLEARLVEPEQWMPQSKIPAWLSEARDIADRVEVFKQMFDSNKDAANRCSGAIPTFSPPGFDLQANRQSATVYQWMLYFAQNWSRLVPWAERVLSGGQCPVGTVGTNQATLNGISKCYANPSVKGDTNPWCSPVACCSSTSYETSAIQISCNGGWNCNWWKCG